MNDEKEIEQLKERARELQRVIFYDIKRVTITNDVAHTYLLIEVSDDGFYYPLKETDKKILIVCGLDEFKKFFARHKNSVEWIGLETFNEVGTDDYTRWYNKNIKPRLRDPEELCPKCKSERYEKKETRNGFYSYCPACGFITPGLTK